MSGPAVPEAVRQLAGRLPAPRRAAGPQVDEVVRTPRVDAVHLQPRPERRALCLQRDGEGAADAGFIGIDTPAGVYGDKGNIKFRFDPSYMQMAAEGKL